MNIRVGFGYDVHKLVADRDLWLGGIKIDYELGLLGHSDAVNMVLFSKSRIRIKVLPLPKYPLHRIVRMLVGFCINSSGCLNNSTI